MVKMVNPVGYRSITSEDAIGLAEYLLLPAPDMDRIGDHWGYEGLGVVCAGDYAMMRQVVDKLHKHNGRLIAASLPIWC